jgi:putative membrane protein
MTVPEPQTGSTNELAKERTRAAAERTLSSWVNNSILLIGFGVAINQIRDDLERLFPLKEDWWTGKVAYNTGLSFIILGMAVLMVAMVQHVLVLWFLERRSQSFKTELFQNLNQIKILMVLTFGVLSLLMMVLKFS